MRKLSDYEEKILLEISGFPQQDLRWGAAMGAAIEFLQEAGYIRIGNPTRLTVNGERYLNERK